MEYLFHLLAGLSVALLATASPHRHQEFSAARQGNSLEENNLDARGEPALICLDKSCYWEEYPQAQPCSGVIDYNYYTWYNGAGMYTGRQNGHVLKVSFTKKRDDTLLRFAFNTNIHTAFARGGGRWSIYIDGRPCNRPAALNMMFYQDSARNTHQPALLEGICKATLGGGNINKGMHSISVEVAQIHGNTSLHTGYDSTTTLEVRELCPPF